MAGADIINLRLQAKKEMLESQIRQWSKVYDDKLSSWSQARLGGVLEKISTLKETLNDVDKLKSQSTKYDRQKVQQHIRRQVGQLLELNRLKKRKRTNQGPKQKIDDELEEFVAKSIEDKATYHGRRHDTVMYVNQRVKKRDLLNIANYKLLQLGRKLIKSSTTIYNRSRPRNVRSLQAKRHLGNWLFCFKKPPKAEDESNENTHYQKSTYKQHQDEFFLLEK